MGEQARRVFADAQAMLDRIVRERWITAHGVVAFAPAASVDHDDIAVFADESRARRLLTWHGLRQQIEKPVVDGQRRPNQALADFVAPLESGVPDWIGGFAVTTGLGIDAHERAFAEAHDDYSAIMAKALADRLAEAFAERLHERVRRELWGYAADERLDIDELIREKYRGIRPAPGYPACPEHEVKRALFDWLGAADIGMGLTDSLAMTPPASVSGFYLAHPQARYFNVGRIGGDQLRDAARRRGVDAEQAQRELSALVSGV